MSHAKSRRPVNTIDRAMFRDMCARFAAAEIEPRWRAADRDKQFPRDFYVAAAAAGLIGITAPDDIGGAGLGAYEEAIAMEEMAKVNPNLAVSVLVQNVAGSILYTTARGAARYRAQSAPAIATGGHHGHQAQAGGVQNQDQSATRRRRLGDGGESFTTLGGDCDVLVTLAQTDSGRGRHGMQFSP
jgi:alkylation response protein AidB-like acyl-CoA dehydrogenase